MNIGILGTGVVGSNLGKALSRVGHRVMFSSRTPDSERIRSLLTDVGAGTQAGSEDETVAFGEVIVVAIGWQNELERVLFNVDSWENKVIIDATNRFGPIPPGSIGSAGEDIAQLTGAPLLKAFNTIGAEHYLDPVFEGRAATMFICGHDAAKEKALPLVTALGFDPIDVGGLEQCALVEKMAELWVGLALHQGYGRNIAFSLLKK